MSDTQEDLARIELAAQQLIPELGERLTRHGLGEIEVRAGGLRVRVAGPPATRKRFTTPWKPLPFVMPMTSTV